MSRFWLLSWLLLTNCIAKQGWVLNTGSDEPYVSVWEVKAGKEIKLPLPEGFNYNFIVDWGDGSQSEITSADDPNKVHIYAATGSYTMRISGLVEAWESHHRTIGSSICTITSVPELGDVGWKSLRFAFYSCKGLTNLRGGDVSQVTNMEEMFAANKSVNPDVSNWDVSNVTNMRAMFSGAASANPDVSNWDVSNVTNMNGMFARGAARATSANPDVSNWDVSNVTNMGAMFSGATSANPEVSNWDVSNVTDMGGMFARGFARSTSANPEVSNWDVSNVTNMFAMFAGTTSANPEVSNWDVSNVTDMSYMFARTMSASPDVSEWDTVSLTDMNAMFSYAQAATPDLSRWNFAKVTCYAYLFEDVTLPTATYSNILLRIAATSDKKGNELCGRWYESGGRYNFPLSAGKSKYNAEAAAARQELIDRGWTIKDGGQE